MFSLINTNKGIIINNNVYAPIRVNGIGALYYKHGNLLYNSNSNVFYANGFIINNGNNEQVLLGDGSTTGELIKQISINNTIDGYRIIVKSINGDTEDIMLSGANGKVAGIMTAPDKVKLDSQPTIKASNATGVTDDDYVVIKKSELDNILSRLSSLENKA